MADHDPIIEELRNAITGRYSLERELGRGGMGAVFLARDVKLDRLVAIKVLPPELAVRPELRERFLRETRTAAAFSHPNIVSVHSVEETGNLLFFVMSYVEGETLTERVKRQGPLPVPDATRLMQEVAWALSYAHGRGVVHRDVKPDNILLERATGRALVMDFGIARSLAASGLTQVGETVGTPHFMSPEQAAGDTLDGRSDLYSLGVVAYFAVSGRLPFEADSAQAVMVAHISQAPVPVARFRPDLPTPLANAIDRCLEKAPADRFATGEALVEALEQVRARRIDVPPAIRVWTVRSDQFFRIGLVLSLLLPQILRIGGAEGAKLIFMGLVFAGTVPALLAQIPIGMRELARQGFSYADLRQGILAIDGEREAVVAATQADPRYGRRRRNRLVALFGGFLLSVAIAVLAATSGTQTEPGRFRVSPFALYVTAVAVCAAMVFLVLAIGILASSGRIDRRIHGLWTGKVGAGLYRLASWRLADVDATSTPAGSRGAATLFTSLDPAFKRRLHRAKPILSRLEKILGDLERRDQQFDAAATEARQGAPSLPGAASAQQQSLLEDLDHARRDVAARRVAILGAVESIRLSLVRLKSGLGNADVVERELEEAERLFDT